MVQPWNILNQLYTYLGYFGSFLSALAGIMLCDYYVIRHRRLNVQDLYKKNGQYRYHGGVNLVGMIAWILGTVAANIGSDYGYLFGLPTAFIVYFVLMKVWYLKKFPQAEVTSGYSDEYLGISVGNDWVIPGYEEFAGVGGVSENILEDVVVSQYNGGKEYEAATGHKLIITFGRQYGSRGKELAGILAKKLDIPIYDEDMIKLASGEMGVDEAVVKQEDETHPNELVHALTAGGMFAAKEYEASVKDVMFQVQSQIIRDLAAKSSCIIVGRCSNYVLDQAKVPTFDIFVVADTEERIQHIKERDHTTYEKAKTYVRQTERRRESYFNYYTSYEWGNPQYYDLCVNTSNTDMEELAEHIAGYINISKRKKSVAEA